MTELIICEKPAQAEKIASALGNPKKHLDNKVPFYEIELNNKKILVGCAVGHLFNLAEKKKNGWKYPVWDIEWKPSHEINKKSDFSKKYLDVLKKLAKQADSFVVACDYDMEGSTIGYNCIRFICKKKDARRMKFSTLTKDELVESYEKAMKHLDFPVIEAGETRHIVDWLYGINLSRALTLAVKKAGLFKLLSIGRVQGPALKIIVERELEIQKFEPKPYWEIKLEGEINKNKVSADHIEGKFQDKKKAEDIIKKTKGKKAVISEIEKKKTQVAPPVPFDLTTLQTEAYRSFGISPKETLSIAQDLYTSGLISYPRTSSQKLPVSLGLDKIIKKLGKIKEYQKICEGLLKDGIKPNEGKKSDSAHPAIFATGEHKKLTDRSKKIYDLITRRFLACFSSPLKRETINVKIDVNGEKFITKGVTILEPGWYSIYHYASLKEQEIPKMEENNELDKNKIDMLEDFTKPPKRYTEASLIKELEKKELGTKSTRAQIVDNLYQRHYIKEKSIEATTLGMSAIKTLEKYCPEIIDERLTRYFENEMDEIMDGKKKQKEVLEESKVVLEKILVHFKDNEDNIGKELLEATKETRDVMSKVGLCPSCSEGDLMIRRGRFGQFVACNKYPKCKTTFSLPSNALIKPVDKECNECKFIQVTVIRKGKRPWTYCLSKECPAKLRWIEEQKKKQAENTSE